MDDDDFNSECLTEATACADDSVCNDCASMTVDSDCDISSLTCSSMMDAMCCTYGDSCGNNTALVAFVGEEDYRDYSYRCRSLNALRRMQAIGDLKLLEGALWKSFVQGVYRQHFEVYAYLDAQKGNGPKQQPSATSKATRGHPSISTTDHSRS